MAAGARGYFFGAGSAGGATSFLNAADFAIAAKSESLAAASR